MVRSAIAHILLPPTIIRYGVPTSIYRHCHCHCHCHSHSHSLDLALLSSPFVPKPSLSHTRSLTETNSYCHPPSSTTSTAFCGLLLLPPSHSERFSSSPSLAPLQGKPQSLGSGRKPLPQPCNIIGCSAFITLLLSWSSRSSVTNVASSALLQPSSWRAQPTEEPPPMGDYSVACLEAKRTEM